MEKAILRKKPKPPCTSKATNPTRTRGFLRWGGLSPVIQKGFNKTMPTFHSPPAKRGIYAFPEGCVERFLLTGKTQTHRNEKPRAFHHRGPLWHHLHYPEALQHALDQRGAWILTTWETYQKCLKKELHCLRSYSWLRVGHFEGKIGVPNQGMKNFLVSSKAGASLDHLEVFIETIQKNPRLNPTPHQR